MTSAALADCNGATSDSASKAKEKRTVFMNRSDSKGHPRDRDFNTNGVIKYRPRMKDLRRSAIWRCGKARTHIHCVDGPDVLCPAAAERASARHHRGCLDLDACRLFNQAHDLHQRHGRIMRAENIAINLPECLQVRQIFFHIHDVPGETHEMFGPGTALGKNSCNVAERLMNLGDKVGRQMTLTVPADHTAGHHETAVGRHPIGISLWCRPTAGLQNLRTRGYTLVLIQHSKAGPFWRV